LGCFSGCLMSSAGIQKLFCGIYSTFKCSFDEFVGGESVLPVLLLRHLGSSPLLFFLFPPPITSSPPSPHSFPSFPELWHIFSLVFVISDSVPQRGCINISISQKHYKLPRRIIRLPSHVALSWEEVC